MYTQPFWASPVSPSVLNPVPGTGCQQLTPTASQPPAQVPPTIRGKVQHGEYKDHTELLAYDFQYKYSGLDDSQALEIIDTSCLWPQSARLGTCPPCTCGSGHGICMRILFLVFIPAGTRSCHTTSITSQTWTNTSTGQQC